MAFRLIQDTKEDLKVVKFQDSTRGETIADNAFSGSDVIDVCGDSLPPEVPMSLDIIIKIKYI